MEKFRDCLDNKMHNYKKINKISNLIKTKIRMASNALEGVHKLSIVKNLLIKSWLEIWTL
jgi:hypothetical protein